MEGMRYWENVGFVRALEFNYSKFFASSKQELNMTYVIMLMIEDELENPIRCSYDRGNSHYLFSSFTIFFAASEHKC